MNTNPPILTCASNRTVTCGAPWTFDVPSAVDFCGGSNVAVSIFSTLTNPPAGQSYSVTQTWLATDACSNTATCSQTITVQLATPPQIVCPSNIVAECAGPAGTPVFFSATAIPACDTNVTIAYYPPPGSLFGLGSNTVVCVATDGLGNSNSCSFTVTIQDTTPPQITCPSNLINVAESPRDSGFAIVNFPLPQATDVCSSNILVYTVPPSGSVLKVGTNTVTAYAVDASGNTNSCTFNIRVIPYRLPVTVTSPADSGPGTLRQALMDANDSPDQNVVFFAIPGSGPFTIHLQSALPEITSPLILDGWTQNGSNGPPVVEVDGSTSSNVIDGLVIRSGPSTIRGLALHGFATGIRLMDASNVVEGVFIGTDLTGTNAPGNSGNGIYITTPWNVIGGTNPGTANIISGNGGNGVQLAGPNASFNVIEGNFIGVAGDGVSSLPNAGQGIDLTDQAYHNMIGGTLSGGDNVIGFNGSNGVALELSAGSRNSIFGNDIFSNGLLGIDLGNDGVTTNHGAFAEEGPNGFQNYPVLTDAVSDGGTTTISGTLTSAPGIYTLEFFLNDMADPSGFGEGQLFLGSASILVRSSGTQSFTVSFQVTATFTQFVTATATDVGGNTSEFSQAHQVRTPPVLGAQPASTNAPIGSAVTLCASASGTPPLVYQWRLNGINIAGATNSCYTIPTANVGQGGIYTVLVGNGVGALATIPADLTLPLPTVQGSDYFSNAVALAGLSGLVSGQNSNATFEVGEPLHAGKVGGKSVWYSWTAPVTGVASFTTLGSTFDTLLAIYTGTNVAFLTPIDSDVDGGPDYTAKTLFNAINKQQYFIAIDGFAGQSGEFDLSWSEQDTPHLLPAITLEPVSQTVAPGSNVTFTALAERVCGEGHLNCPFPSHYPPEFEIPNLNFQWTFFGSPIPGATGTSLTISNAGPEQLGKYTFQAFTPYQTNESQVAQLQLNDTGGGVEPVLAVDKIEDAITPLFIGGATSSSASASGPGPKPLDGGSVVRGFTGSQVFNTGGAGTGPTEVICGVIGGASEWISFVPLASGMLVLTTDGSSYDTVMADFVRSGTNGATLQLVGCDNNSGSNGITSKIVIPVTAGQTNYIDVDGVNGVTGVLQLNYSLITTTLINIVGTTPQGAQIVEVNGRTNLNFAIQFSIDLDTWTTLITTNSPTGKFDFPDPGSIASPNRVYRALLLP
jgi:hypothetical protein